MDNDESRIQTVQPSKSVGPTHEKSTRQFSFWVCPDLRESFWVSVPHRIVVGVTSIIDFKLLSGVNNLKMKHGPGIMYEGEV